MFYPCHKFQSKDGQTGVSPQNKRTAFAALRQKHPLQRKALLSALDSWTYWVVEYIILLNSVCIAISKVVVLKFIWSRLTNTWNQRVTLVKKMQWRGRKRPTFLHTNRKTPLTVHWHSMWISPHASTHRRMIEIKSSPSSPSSPATYLASSPGPKDPKAEKLLSRQTDTRQIPDGYLNADISEWWSRKRSRKNDTGLSASQTSGNPHGSMKIGSRDFGRAGHHHHSHHTISPLSVDIHWFTTFRLTLSLSTVAALAEYSASALAIHCALKFRYPWHHTDTAHAIYLKHHLAEVEWIDLSEHLYDIYKNPFFSVIMEVSTGICFRSFPWEKSNCAFRLFVL